MNTKNLSALALLGLVPMQMSAAKAKQPNVIFVITDDQGYGDLACHGNEIIKTPNIDNLYAESVRLTNYHVSPTSAPSRSAIMTGRYSDRVGVWHTVSGRSLLWEDEVTMAQVFKASGYNTAMFGKWHLGDNYPSRAEDKGFDEVLIHGGGGISQGPDYWENDYFDDHYRHNGVWEQQKGYCTDVFFGGALSFIEQNKKKPFFCYLSLNAPHGPLHVPEKYYNMYKGNENLQGNQHRFYGMITNIDDNMGVLMSKIKELGIEDNTILIFTTDNGTAQGIKKKKGKTYGHDGGMKGSKGSPYEGGHRVPFFMRYPNGKLVGGYDINTLVAHIDLLPTMIDLCDLKKDVVKKKLDGMSLMPLLKDKNAAWPDRTLYSDSQRDLEIEYWKKTAAMTQQWRLVNGEELYEIAKDPKQTTNVASKHPEVVAKLKADYDAWWNEIAKTDDVNNRYARIGVGSPRENPVRISAHDIMVAGVGAFNQHHARVLSPKVGTLRLKAEKSGKYRISLCRYPKELNAALGEILPARASTVEVITKLSVSKAVNFVTSELKINGKAYTSEVDMKKNSVDFELELKAGELDVIASFTDDMNKKYTPNYIYVEKLD